MSTRILVKPAEDYFVAFLSTRGVHVTSEDPDVIHYFGESKKEISKLAKEFSPDLVLIHNKKAFDSNYKFLFALDEISSDRDIYKNKLVTTNAFELSRLHYQSLGLERMMIDLNEEKKEKDKDKPINNFYIKKLFNIMLWD